MTSAASPVSVEIVAPNGETVRGVYSTEERYTPRTTFRAPSKGTYYARLSGAANLSYALTIALARVFQFAMGQDAVPKKLEIGGLDLWKFQGKAGEMVSIRAKAAGMGVVTTIEYLAPAQKEDEGQLPDAPSAPIVQLPIGAKEPSQTMALLNRTGTYQVAISQLYGQEIDYSLAATTGVKPIPPSGTSEGKLAIGGSDYWEFDGKAGEVIRLSGKSEQFDTTLTLFTPEGEELGSNDDGDEGTNALLTIALLRAGRYFLRIHSVGGGGSGDYRIQTLRNSVKTLAFDKREQGRIGSESSEVWSFQGRAGQTIILSTRSTDFDVSVTLRGADGVEIGSDDNGGDGTNSLLSRRLPLTGVYTIWVNAVQGRGSYVLRLIEAP
jgi:hypothetical protein